MEEEKEINFDTLADVKVDDISTLGIPSEKLDVLTSLGVNSFADFTASQQPKKDEQPAEKSEAEQKDEDEKLKEQESEVQDIVVDTDVDAPNIIIPKVELIRALRYANVMIKQVTGDVESSSLNITYSDDGKVLYRLKDNMTWVKIIGNCEVANNNLLTKTLSFKTAYLTKLLSAAASNVLIYEGKAIDQKSEEGTVYYVRLINGDYILDTTDNAREDRLVPAGNKTEKLGSVPHKVLSNLCDVMIPLVSDTQEVSSKRSIVYNDRAIFKSVTYLLQYRNAFTQMCLSKKDLDLLKLLSLSDTDISIYSTNSEGENRIIFETPTISISTSVSIPNRDSVLISRLETLEKAKYMKVNKDDFKRVLMLSGLGINNAGTLYMNYSVEGNALEASIEGKIGNSTLTISGDNYNNLEPKDIPVKIYAPQLLSLLKSFEGGSSLEIAFLDEGVAFKDETIGIEAIMNYAN